MAITSEQVRDLRERTGAGMMDCKRALEETGGDLDKAVSYLREKGLATAAKKAGRVASEGIVDAFIAPDRRTGALIEINSETDFVAKNPEFRAYADEVIKGVAAGNGLSVTNAGEGADLQDLKLASGESAGAALTAMIAKIGENMTLRRYARFAITGGQGLIESYLHMVGVGQTLDAKVAVLIELSFNKEETAKAPASLALAKDLAMQIAASKPEYVKREEVPADVVEREKAIYKAQSMNEGKPEQVAEKIVIGRLDKYFKDVCLLEQVFIKDQNQSCRQVVQAVAAQLGDTITVTRFARFERGEGLAKRSEDFAAEVQAQIKGS